jgi:hypothetical protein
MKDTYHPFSRSHARVAAPLLLVLAFGSCQNNPESSSLGSQFVDSETRVSLIDTFSVRLSTVIFDTMVTSGTEQILVGDFHDDVFGGISSESYMQIGVPESYDVQSEDLFDSLRLILTYNQYFFGDTTRTQTMFVHRLTEGIEYEYGNVITSQSSFSYNSTPLGSIEYLPTPGVSGATLSIPIDDNLGRRLLEQLAEASEAVTDNEAFNDYFPGLLLRTDPASTGNIVGFTASGEGLRLVLYTRKADTYEDNPIMFKLRDSTRQFNHIVHDFASTPLTALTKQRIALPSGQTGGASYAQGCVGLAIRVDFPSLPEALLYARSTLLAARLSISPQNNSYSESSLPSNLVLYESDGLNTLGSGIATSTLSADYEYKDRTTYSFDVTEYLRSGLADSYVDPEEGLLITLPSNELTSRFSRLIGDAHSKNTKLSLYYLSY